MREFLTALLTMAAQGSLLALLIVALRFLLKKLKVPAWIRVLLWAAVAVRLVLPVLPKTTVSVMPLPQTVSEYVELIVPEEAPAVQVPTDLPATTRPEGATYDGSQEQDPEKRIPFGLSAAQVCFAVWALGAAGTLVWGAISYLRLKRKVRVSVKTEKNVYLCDAIQSPFLLGLFRPRIYVPSFLEGNALCNVLAHERAHIRRGDHLIKPLSFLLLAVYWFNPLFWLAYALLCRDIEYACDEKVLKTMARGEIAAYSETLLSFHAPGRAISACPVAFGEAGVRQRVKAALSYKKPAFWILLVAAVAAAGVAVFFLTDRTTDLSRVFPPEDETVRAAVSAWLLKSPGDAEATAEGHVLLGTAQKNGGLEAYVWYSAAGLCFENGILTSDTGGNGFATFLLEPQSGGGYTVKDVTLPQDGEDRYASSLREMMPSSLVRRAEENMGGIAVSVKAQKEAYAKAYLDSLGRKAEIIVEPSELPERTLLADVVVPLTVERIDRDYPALADYPYYIGTLERVENGMRWVYETEASADRGLITFTKRNYADGLVYSRTLLDFNTADVVDSLVYDMYPMTSPQFTEGSLVYGSKAGGDLNQNGVPDTLYLCDTGDGFYLLGVENGSAFACDQYKTNGEIYTLTDTGDPEAPIRLQAHYFTEDGILSYDAPVVYRQGEEYNPGLFHWELYVARGEDGYPEHFGSHMSYDAARLLVGPMEYAMMGQTEIPEAGVTLRLSVETPDASGGTLSYRLETWDAPSNREVTYGVGYQLQKFSGGRWVDLPLANKNFAFTTEAYDLTATGRGTVDARWAQGYGELPYNAFGECYRVLAPVHVTVDGRHYDLTLAAPFALVHYYNQ